MKNRHRYKPQDHTFVVLAYQESPYLEECIYSCVHQSVRSRVIVATSTPNRHILKTAEKYGLPVYVREPEKARTKNGQEDNQNTIGLDWNFALSVAGTKLVTLAHQDDRYGRRYKEHVLQAANRCKRPLILFTDYAELRNGEIEKSNKVLRVKRTLLLPLIGRKNWKNRWIRRRVLSMGNSICAPTVTYAMDQIKMPFFENNMISNIDWQAWEQLSKQEGEFAYIPVPCMLHRIHEESTTSKLLFDDGRRAEDMKVFRKFWPEPVAGLIEKVYKSAEKSNRV